MLRLLVWLLLVSALGATAGEPAPTRIEFWHGATQRVGHRGLPQGDFNLLGHVAGWQHLQTLEYAVNDGVPTSLSFQAYRRLARDGDFNADIPVANLRPGRNTLTVTARRRDGGIVSQSAAVLREEGTAPLPFAATWRDVADPQEVGQAVDGRWERSPHGLRCRETGYDRLFLIGDRAWRDYEVRTTLTVHQVHAATDRVSGPSGLGLILRFAGHTVGGHRRFPTAQPKWGYQPFGAIAWLRWTRGAAEAPQLQFYPGDTDRVTDHGAFPIVADIPHTLRVRCETLPDSAAGEGVTRYSCKLWHAGTPEPPDWSWQQVLVSRHALRQGGVALVAHHVDATFGDIVVDRIGSD